MANPTRGRPHLAELVLQIRLRSSVFTLLFSGTQWLKMKGICKECQYHVDMVVV